ncbi:MAG: ATP-dependent helicase [Syntrophales bacterium]
MLKLSQGQMAIVHAEIGAPIQVLASAGSGKTRVLTERIRYILQSTKKEGIIAITFTNKAAEEIKARLADVEDLGERCWLATIHSLAQRILDQYGHTIGLPSELHIYDRDKDRSAVFLQSLRDESIDVDDFLNVDDVKVKKKRERIIQDLLEAFSSVKRNLLSEEEIKKKYSDDGKFLQYYQAYQKALLEAQAIDYDDMLFFARRILIEQAWCGDVYRAKYRHILVDEAQDLNKAQYEFIKALCGDSIKSILMVGDPNQMIYGFNDSSEKYLTEHFVNDFNPTAHRLTENYRSTITVIQAANKLKPGAHYEENIVLPGICEITSHANEEDEASWICDTVQKFIGTTSEELEDTIGLEKFVVIARNRFVFSALEDELKKRQIPFAFKKGERSAEPITQIGKVLDYAIRYKLNPKDWVDGKKLCDAINVGYPTDWSDSDQLIEFAQKQDADIIRRLLITINELDLDEPNIPKLCKSILQALDETSLGMTDEEREMSIKEIDNYLALWTNFKRKGLGNSLAAFRNALSLGQLSEEMINNGITLSTVHTMKGLEHDIVFLMGMCEGVFPDYRATTAKQIEEERNNAYVAVTRARRWLLISYPRVRKMPWGDYKQQTPSRFLEAMKS